MNNNNFYKDDCCNFSCNPFPNCCCQCAIGPRGPQGVQGPRGVTGPTGATGQAQIVAYGGLFNKSISSIIVPPLNIEEQLPMPNQMPYQNVVLGVNTITIIVTGDYSVTQKFSALTSGGDAFEVKIALRINGIIIPEMEHSLTVNIISISDTSDFIIRLNANDVLDFVIFSEVGGTVNFRPTTTPSLTLLKLGD